MKSMFSTKEVSNYLSVNEKMVYSLITEKKLPATKITGKWLFPKDLVDRWIEANTINIPEENPPLPPYHGLLIISGSNDPLLEKTVTLFNSQFPAHHAVFGNTGSIGGLTALGKNLCHMASCHLLSEDNKEYNFDFALKELDQMPAVVNFCKREQGLIIQKGNPEKIESIKDLAEKNLRVANRPESTGTRLLFDQELLKADIDSKNINGYDDEFSTHLDAGVEVLSGRVDATLGIKAIATLLNLDFLPLRWERYDLLIRKERFFDEGVQLLLGLLHEERFRNFFSIDAGYDLSLSGKMVYPG